MNFSRSNECGMEKPREFLSFQEELSGAFFVWYSNRNQNIAVEFGI